jgi:predicted TIM-barrel fold metal-dependent hydrolase
LLFELAPAAGSLVNPEFLLGMFTRISRLSPDDGRKILGLGPNMKESELLKEIVARTKKLAAPPTRSLTPFRDALCAIVAELFAAHEARSAKIGPVTQFDVWEAFLQTMPTPAYERVIVLSVDMDEAFVNENLPGLSGVPKNSFAHQTSELAELASVINLQGGVQIIPFLCVDPRGHTAADLVNIVASNCGKDLPWKGIKLYPSMGILPSESRLQGVFDYCQDHSIPILTHCSVGGAGVRGSVHNYAENAHPKEWATVLDRLAQRGSGGMMRLCLAHLDGLDFADNITWAPKIIELMRKHDGSRGVELYGDVAFNLIPDGDPRALYQKNVQRFKNDGIDKRVIFGSDWWMYLYECPSETEFIKQLDLNQAGSWVSEDLDAAADAFLTDVL